MPAPTQRHSIAVPNLSKAPNLLLYLWGRLLIQVAHVFSYAIVPLEWIGKALTKRGTARILLNGTEQQAIAWLTDWVKDMVGPNFDVQASLVTPAELHRRQDAAATELLKHAQDSSPYKH